VGDDENALRARGGFHGGLLSARFAKEGPTMGA
jgi:hypothetical protein